MASVARRSTVAGRDGKPARQRGSRRRSVVAHDDIDPGTRVGAGTTRVAPSSTLLTTATRRLGPLRQRRLLRRCSARRHWCGPACHPCDAPRRHRRRHCSRHRDRSGRRAARPPYSTVCGGAERHRSRVRGDSRFSGCAWRSVNSQLLTGCSGRVLDVPPAASHHPLRCNLFVGAGDVGRPDKRGVGLCRRLDVVRHHDGCGARDVVPWHSRRGGEVVHRGGRFGAGDVEFG